MVDNITENATMLISPLTDDDTGTKTRISLPPVNITKVISGWSESKDIELLLNKKRYNKYLEKNNPEKLREIEEHRRNKLTHFDKIIQTCENYLTDSTFQISHSIDELFEEFTTKLIKHIELQEYQKRMENDSYENDGDNDAENMMFAAHNEPLVRRSSSSLWGRKIHKYGDVSP